MENSIQQNKNMEYLQDSLQTMIRKYNKSIMEKYELLQKIEELQNKHDSTNDKWNRTREINKYLVFENIEQRTKIEKLQKENEEFFDEINRLRILCGLEQLNR